MEKIDLAPFFDTTVPAGFPSPAADYEEQKLDLNRYLITHPAATFFVRAEGDSMKGAGIHSGDLLIVDRALEPASGKIVIAHIAGEFTVKRLRCEGENIWLDPENGAYPPLKVPPSSDFQVWGVVTYVIHKCSTL